MTLKDVQRRHETRERIVHSIIRVSQNNSTIKMSLVSELTEQLEVYRKIDLQLITEFQSAQEILNPCKGVGSNPSNLISTKEAEAALQGPKTATDIPTAHYRSIMEDAIRCGAAMPKTTQTPITSLEELDNLYQQIREQFIKENP